MLVVVKTPFVGHGRNMDAPGTLLDVPDDLAQHLLAIDAVSEYETKVDPLPEVTKKKKRSASLPADPAPRKRTRRSSKKSAKKS